MFKNDVFSELLNRYHENKMSHAFLLETNDFDKCSEDVIRFIKIINCLNEYSDDCSNDNCNICNLIDNRSLPSFIWIDPDGTQIKKVQIQSVLERFQTKPIFSKYNVYVINQCEKLNVSSANSLLKFLEEPEDNIIGFYITNNKMNVISTIRSRCQEYNIYYDLETNDFKYIDLIKEYLNAIYKSDNSILYNKTNAVNYFKERTEWIDFFKEMLYVLYSYIKNGGNSFDITLLYELPRENIIKIVDLIESILKYIQSNGNIELILDKFVIEMRNFYA